MSRQILTFFIVFGGLMLLFRSCNSETGVPPALTSEGLRAESDTSGRVLLEDQEKGFSAKLARDGTIYLSFHIVRATEQDHRDTKGRGFGIMCSKDRGETWKAVP